MVLQPAFFKGYESPVDQTAHTWWRPPWSGTQLATTYPRHAPSVPASPGTSATPRPPLPRWPASKPAWQAMPPSSSSATRVAVGTEMAEPRGSHRPRRLKELLDMTATQTRGRSGLSDRQPSLADGDDRPDPLLLCLRRLRGGRTSQACTSCARRTRCGKAPRVSIPLRRHAAPSPVQYTGQPRGLFAPLRRESLLGHDVHSHRHAPLISATFTASFTTRLETIA